MLPGFLKQEVQTHHRSYNLVVVSAEGQLRATGDTTHKQDAGASDSNVPDREYQGNKAYRHRFPLVLCPGWYFITLTQLVIWEEGTSTEKMFPTRLACGASLWDIS